MARIRTLDVLDRIDGRAVICTRDGEYRWTAVGRPMTPEWERAIREAVGAGFAARDRTGMLDLTPKGARRFAEGRVTA